MVPAFIPENEPRAVIQIKVRHRYTNGPMFDARDFPGVGTWYPSNDPQELPGDENYR